MTAADCEDYGSLDDPSPPAGAVGGGAPEDRDAAAAAADALTESIRSLTAGAGRVAGRLWRRRERIAVGGFALILMVGYWSIGLFAGDDGPGPANDGSAPASAGRGDGSAAGAAMRMYSFLYGNDRRRRGGGEGALPVSDKKLREMYRTAQAVAGLQMPVGYPPVPFQFEYDRLVREVDWRAVERDLRDLMVQSREWWPADYGTYAGLFIRLSWHSCGSYRVSDGRGGCDGGGQR